MFLFFSLSPSLFDPPTDIRMTEREIWLMKILEKRADRQKKTQDWEKSWFHIQTCIRRKVFLVKYLSG